MSTKETDGLNKEGPTVGEEFESNGATPNQDAYGGYNTGD